MSPRPQPDEPGEDCQKNDPPLADELPLTPMLAVVMLLSLVIWVVLLWLWLR